ncbi:hypothetical protein VI01_05350 [Pantoea sp. SM3]|nr:hypothetical protein VI01_05350 [Pantoea sp. SM3]
MSLMTSGNRRDFLSAGIKLTAAGTLLGAGLSGRTAVAAACAPENLTHIDVSHYLLRNVSLEEGFVPVWSGTDTIADHWQPFGSGSMLEKANVYAQLYRGPDEFSLSRALGIATNEVLPLNSQGEQQWPKAQDSATMMLVAASCSAEAVAHIAPVMATFHNGKQVFGQLKKI